VRAGAQARGSRPAALHSADDFVTQRYGQAQAAGLNLVRMFATQGDNGTNLALEPRPGTYVYSHLAVQTLYSAGRAGQLPLRYPHYRNASLAWGTTFSVR
jgi:hypothetical protein